MKRLGFLVNPVAGIGGKVGLKGSDGAATLERALELGAVPESGKKALITMKALREVAGELDIYACPGEMGADICAAAGLKAQVVGEIAGERTTPEDTIRCAQALRDRDLDLLLFAGGDGTARNILDAVGTSVTVLGIPTGCKIHSGVYALNPRTAGLLMAQYAMGSVRETKEAEVMDIDEELFRQGIVQAQLYGYLKIPNETKMVQNLKSGRGYSEQQSTELLANYISDHMERDTLYIVGTGSTTAAIMKKMELLHTLLGVDLVLNGKTIARDCTERELLTALDTYRSHPVKIIVTVIGGQGYIFGRGNQQISAEVIRRVGRENIIVAASKGKILSLFGQNLYVDTGDEEVNHMLRGYMRVIVGYEDEIMMRVSD